MKSLWFYFIRLPGMRMRSSKLELTMNAIMIMTRVGDSSSVEERHGIVLMALLQ
jgi:hypothetical protein